MLFTVKERLLLLNALPCNSGSVIFVRIIKQFRDALSFSEQEAEMLKFSFAENQTTWEDDGTQKEIEVGPKVLDFIKSGLQRIDSQERVTEDLLPLFDRFVDSARD